MKRRRELLSTKPLFPGGLRCYIREDDAITGYAATQNADGLDEARAVLLVGSGRGLQSWVEDKGRRVEQTVNFSSAMLADRAEQELQAKGFKRQ